MKLYWMFFNSGCLPAPGDRLLAGDKVLALKEHLRYKTKYCPFSNPFLNFIPPFLYQVITEVSP